MASTRRDGLFRPPTRWRSGKADASRKLEESERRLSRDSPQPMRVAEPTLLSTYQQLLKELSDLLREGSPLIEDKEAVVTVHDALLRIKLWGQILARTPSTIYVSVLIGKSFSRFFVPLNVRLEHSSSSEVSPDEGLGSHSLDLLTDAVDRLTDLAEIIMTYMELASGKGTTSGILAALTRKEAIQEMAESAELKGPAKNTETSRTKFHDSKSLQYQPVKLFELPVEAGDRLSRSTPAKTREIPYQPMLRSLTSTSLDLDPYYHRQLNEDEVRLLVLHPGDLQEPIRCSLIQTNLDQISNTKLPEFQAVSYAWGTQSSERTIFVADASLAILNESTEISTNKDLTMHFHSYQVRHTVHSVLQQLRRSRKNVVLWINVLCIDLRSDPEKTHHYQKVPKIFNLAKDVCIWLGDGSEQTDLAMDFIPEMVDLHNFERLMKDEKYIEPWRAFAGLMRHPYFNSRWIIQDVAVARRATLRCGDKFVSWIDFSDAVSTLLTNLELVKNLFATRLVSSNGSLGDIETSGVNLLVRDTTNLFRKSDDGFVLKPLLNLETLLSTFPPMDVRSPHDYIYSLFFMANDEASRSNDTSEAIGDTKSGYSVDDLWRVDYMKDIFQLYREVITHCIWSSQSLDLICRELGFPKPETFTSSAGEPIAEEEFPSWVPFAQKPLHAPDRTVPLGRQSADSLVGFPGHRVYKAAGKRKLTLEYGIGGRFNFTLNVRGSILDAINYVSPRMAGGIVPRECMEMIGYNTALKPDDQQATIDILLSILVAKRGPDGKKPPLWYKHALRYCLENITLSGDLDTRAILEGDPPDTVKEFLKRVQSVVWNRTAFRAGHFFGLTSTRSRVGDVVCVLYGCSVPVILRERKGGGWTFLGETYVHGAMDGESAEAVQENVYFELY